MKKLFISTAFVLSSIVTFGQTTWKSDIMHSNLGFIVKHLTISEINGRFTEFNVTVNTSKADYSDAQVELTAQIASINTDVEARDNHLRSADFFDAENYPTLTFKSTSMEKVDDNNGKLLGDLTFHGVTKPVVLNVHYFGTVINSQSQAETAGFQIIGEVKRSDFELGTGFPEALISNTIKIVANIQFSPIKK